MEFIRFWTSSIESKNGVVNENWCIVSLNGSNGNKSLTLTLNTIENRKIDELPILIPCAEYGYARKTIFVYSHETKTHQPIVFMRNFCAEDNNNNKSKQIEKFLMLDAFNWHTTTIWKNWFDFLLSVIFLIGEICCLHSENLHKWSHKLKIIHEARNAGHDARLLCVINKSKSIWCDMNEIPEYGIVSRSVFSHFFFCNKNRIFWVLNGSKRGEKVSRIRNSELRLQNRWICTNLNNVFFRIFFSFFHSAVNAHSFVRSVGRSIVVIIHILCVRCLPSHFQHSAYIFS